MLKIEVCWLKRIAVTYNFEIWFCYSNKKSLNYNMENLVPIVSVLNLKMIVTVAWKRFQITDIL